MNWLVLALILLDFWILSVSRIRTMIKILVLQGIVLSIWAMQSLTAPAIFLGCVILLVKSIVFPCMFVNLAGKLTSSIEDHPYISYSFSPILGAICYFISHYMSPELSPAIFTIMVGLFMAMTRKQAINQVISFLIFENGIFVLGFLLAAHIPLVMEVAILLDVFAAMLMMKLSIARINQAFTHTDVEKLNTLKG